jgi:peptidyl-prolyl cis-trans isomerase B (cyclophilin B)
MMALEPTREGLYPEPPAPLSWRAVNRVTLVLLLAFAVTACGGEKKPPAPAPTATPAVQRDANGCLTAEAPTPKSVTLEKPTAKLDPAKTYIATVTTNCGAFDITLDVNHAPKTAASFKSLADQKFYDGTNIHRIVANFVFQGGVPQLNGTGGPGYQVVEKPPKDFTYDPGVVAMAKSGSDPPGASGSQFFVVTGPDAKQLPADYALLGRISGGRPVVAKLGAIVTDPRTDSPEAPVVIGSIRVSER